MAGILTYSTFTTFPFAIANSGILCKSDIELTATGIVPDLHQIPFSFQNQDIELGKPKLLSTKVTYYPFVEQNYCENIISNINSIMGCILVIYINLLKLNTFSCNNATVGKRMFYGFNFTNIIS